MQRDPYPPTPGDEEEVGYYFVQKVNDVITICDDEGVSYIYGDLETIISTWGSEQISITPGGSGRFIMPEKGSLLEQTYQKDGDDFEPTMSNYTA